MSKAYELYLQSDHWQKLKQRVYKQRKGKCEICGKLFSLEVHHVNYNYNNTNKEINYVRLVCHTHHILCHWTLFGKVPMTPRSLKKRYQFLKKNHWRQVKLSVVLSAITEFIFNL